MSRLLIILGSALLFAGIAWPWIRKLPLGRLPGDIIIDRPGMKFFFPLTTMILVSLVVSLIFWLWRR